MILIRWFQGKQQCCGVSGWEPVSHLDSFFIKFILLISASGVGTVGNIPHIYIYIFDVGQMRTVYVAFDLMLSPQVRTRKMSIVMVFLTCATLATKTYSEMLLGMEHMFLLELLVIRMRTITKGRQS